jgi:hypothetical protein
MTRPHAMMLWLLLSLAAVSAGVAWARPARAEEASDRAVALGKKGLDLYNERRWVEAFDRFALAERELHSPVFVLYMGRCKLQAGQLLAARSHLEQVATEALPEGAPEPWQAAQREAKSELAALLPTIPSIRVRVEGAESAGVWIDGSAIADPARPIELDPGEHVIEARAGERRARRKLVLAAGSREELVTLVIEPAPAPPPEGPPPTVVAGAVLLGLGGAALVVGAVTGGLALSITGDIEDNCVDGHCLASDQDEGDRAATLATAATVSFVIAGVAAAAGITLMVVPYATSDEPGAWSAGLLGRF